MFSKYCLTTRVKRRNEVKYMATVLKKVSILPTLTARKRENIIIAPHTTNIFLFNVILRMRAIL